ncbi:MAG TPA: alpha-glucosidase C-terminal domain-containing protein, partial [Anaerolineales bacterium]|nr:alpha-glucosidase C-terminal domain-containing protein [Anaerolineales bacterium]
WCTFLRNHDELTLEMVTEQERQWMWEQYAPEPRMRLNLGIRRRLASLLDHDPRKIALANSLLFTLPGSPIIYYGDEIGMSDNIQLEDRNGVRTPMQWQNSVHAGFSKAQKAYSPIIDEPLSPLSLINVDAQRKDPRSLWNTIHGMILMRKSHPALADGSFQWIDCRNQAVFAYSRDDGQDRLLFVHNLSDQEQKIEIDFPAGRLQDMFRGTIFIPAQGQFELTLKPFGYSWLWEPPPPGSP